MNPPSEDIKDMLVASSAGLGHTFGIDMFISEMPDSPDVCYCIYDTGGIEPEVQYEYDRPAVQVRVRGAKSGYRSAWLAAKDIRDTLHGVHNETWNSTRYVGIWCMGDILFAGYDDSGRPQFTINFRIHRVSA
jgi:hypothetical protein